MLNILVRENDSYFCKGIMDALSELFVTEYKQAVLYSFDFCRENVENADVILLDMSPGEIYLCAPKFLSRTKGIIVGIVAAEMARKPGLPACFADMVFVSRGVSVVMLKQVVLQAWRAKSDPFMTASCTHCRHKMPTELQIRVMTGILSGKSLTEVAREMNMKKKTAFAHKYHLMSKYNLHSVCELMHFMRRLQSVPDE